MKKSIGLLFIPLLLVSCGGTAGGTSVATSLDTSSTSSTDTTTESSSSPSTSWPSDVNRDIAINGDIIDQAVGFCWEVDRTYSFGFTFSDSSSESEAIVTLSDPSSAVMEGGNGNYTIVPKKAGDYLFTIENSDGYLYYRTVLKFRDKIPQEDFYDYLLSVDHYQSWVFGGTNLQLAFLPNNQVTVQGIDEYVSIGSITFEIEYLETKGAEYIYTIKNWENPYSELQPTTLNISTMGEVVHMCDNLGVLVVFALPE